jgi:hypothetical protein
MVCDDRIDKTYTMPLSQRLIWLIGEIRRLHFVNILNEDFVDAYINHTNAPHEIMLYGTNRCPRLSQDLRRLYNKQRISRTAIGVPYARLYQFPTWVWSYYMKENTYESHDRLM